MNITVYCGASLGNDSAYQAAAEKLRYLADAPQKDPEGNEAIIRFSRKEKHQYVTSEKNGKATKWIVDYIDGKWVERKK